MPKNPWIYRSRKRRRKRRKSIEDGELIENSRMPNSSEPDIHIESLSSEILRPLNQLKKEFIYPDTRFQCSTTLFPAIGENSLQFAIPLKRDPDEGTNGPGQEPHLMEQPDPNDKSIFIGKNGPGQEPHLIEQPDPDKSIFIGKNGPGEEPHLFEQPDPDDKSIFIGKNGPGEEPHLIEQPDPDDESIFIEVMSAIPLPSDNPLENGDTVYPDIKLQHSTTPFPAQEIENIIPSEKQKCEPEDDTFVKTPKKVKLDDLPISDDCVILRNPNSLDEVDEIDLTEDSHRIISCVITLE